MCKSDAPLKTDAWVIADQSIELQFAVTSTVTDCALPEKEFALKNTLSVTVGTQEQLAPPLVVAQCVTSLQLPVPPIQNRLEEKPVVEKKLPESIRVSIRNKFVSFLIRVF